MLNGSWRLVAPLEYRGNKDQFTVPEGFVTDFASVPRIFQSFAPKMGRQNRASVLHDWMYRTKPALLRSAGFVAITRRDADGIFRRTMKEDGVRWLRRYTYWLAVRVGGWYPWRKK